MRAECRIVQAFDFGFAVDLERAAARLSNVAEVRLLPAEDRPRLRLVMAAPPLRLALPASLEVGGVKAQSEVEVALHDFASASITWTLPFDGDAADLLDLAIAITAERGLTQRGLDLMGWVLERIRDSVEEPLIAAVMEDQIVFRLEPGPEVAELLADRKRMASILRADRGELADDEIESALMLATACHRDEAVIVDWQCALVVGRDMAAELSVLEIAQVQLVSLRQLDRRLSEGILRAYHSLRRAEGGFARLSLQHRDLGAIGRIEADLALLHEGIDNALVVLEDVYLARVQRLTKARFRMDEFDRSIDRKIASLRAIYEKLGHLAGQRRNELLEWIIILLIAFEIVLSFFQMT